MPECKETQCTHCIHRIVCKLNEDYLRINEAINRLSVAKSEQGDRDELRIRSIPIVNFDFVEVTVSCKYYERKDYNKQLRRINDDKNTKIRTDNRSKQRKSC